MTHGGAPAGWLEFSANLNPLGAPAAVAAAVAAVAYDRYADLDPAEAEAHLALDAGVPAESVLLTAGATEAIRLIATAFLARGRAVVVGPTYSEYERVARQANAEVDAIRAEAPAFDPPVEAAFGRALGGDVLFICDPNNPTGRQLDIDRLRRLLMGAPADLTIVLDQSFLPFAPAALGAAECIDRGNVVLVRSLTKALAVPGLRLGYVIAPPPAIARLRAFQDPWSVAAHAIAAAQVASWSLPPGARDTIVAWRERFAAALDARCMRSVPSAANFLLVHAGPEVPGLVTALAARRIAVRSGASFGLPEHLRLAVRPPAEQDALFGALAAAGTAW